MHIDRRNRTIHIGDIVRGQPYNIPHEIIGEVVDLLPNGNLVVAVARVARCQDVTGYVYSMGTTPKIVVSGVEYGAAGQFEVIQEGRK